MGFSKVLPNVHLNKDWQENVKTFFNQPGKKLRRRKIRAAKAKRVGPNPTHKLRPAVRGQTRRYNNKLKLGRGFTLAELKLAGIKGVQYAKSIGIAIDRRRKDTCSETQKLNADRIKEYASKIILFPKRKPESKPIILEATADQIKFSETQPQNLTKSVIPLPKAESAFSFTQITKKLQDEIVYKTLRKEWKDQSGFNRRLEAKKKRAAAAKK
jgi:large subunit ribosomal protein L13e